ncbi:hypothetical protein SPB21_03660 [Leptothoe sp. ISB3NOV94-8A]
MARPITMGDMKRAIALRMAASINDPDRTNTYASAVEAYGAFTGASTTSLQERDRVVRQAMADHPDFFPEF